MTRRQRIKCPTPSVVASAADQIGSRDSAADQQGETRCKPHTATTESAGCVKGDLSKSRYIQISLVN